MRLTHDGIRADNARMEKIICERISGGVTRIDLGGGAWADLRAFWDDRFGWSLLLETDEPEWVDLREVYDHFRRKEMTAREWERELAGEMNRWKVHDLERENAVLRNRQNGLLAPGIIDAPGVHLDQSAVTHELARIESKLDRITALLIQQKTTKEWYSTADAAERLGKAEFTVREWCRLGHCKAEKRNPTEAG